jgi:HPt (histidine-containing phosphotransfer) domain-containing protein
MWINTTYLMQRLDDDVELTTDLLSVFLTEFERLLAELQTGLNQQANVTRLSHSLKGMCRDVGANQLADWAADIEHHQANPLERASQLAEVLPQVTQEVTQWVNAHAA